MNKFKQELNILGDRGTLNIFTDASIRSFTDSNIKETIGCAGAFCVAGNFIDEIIDKETYILRQATNNSSEIMALRLGVSMAIKYMKYYPHINLFSDSKICIYGLREWIFKWINNIDHNILYTDAGKKVSNQITFKSIINDILLNNLHISLYHVKGHVNTNNMENLMNAKRVFAESNNIELLSIDEIKNISECNNCVDMFTRIELEGHFYPLLNREMKYLFDYKMDRIKINSVYKNLINH